MDGFAKIDSLKNEYVKFLRGLSTKKGRYEAGMFLVEGVKCTLDALNSDFEVEKILAAGDVPDELLAERDKIICVPMRIIEAVSDTKTPQNIVSCVKMRGYDARYSGLTVVLDGVSDPKNVGSIIRSADAAGAECVVLSETCADMYGPKAVRSAMGSIFHVPAVVCDIKRYLSEFCKNGIAVCGHLKGEETFGCGDNTCIVIGNEARGVSGDVAALCEKKYRIPIYGRAESLNAGVAAGIMLYKAAECMRSHKI